VSDRDEPVAPTLEELDLTNLLVSALNNLQHFEETFPDGELKNYIRNRAYAHIRKHKSTRTMPLA
jgi:hypothetical protein